MLVMLLVMQAVPRTIEVATLPDSPLVGFDLAKVKPQDRESWCNVDNLGSDILVCGRHKNLDIDISLMPDFTAEPVRVGRNLSDNARVSVEGERREVGGFISNAGMVKLKIGF